MNLKKSALSKKKVNKRSYDYKVGFAEGEVSENHRYENLWAGQAARIEKKGYEKGYAAAIKTVKIDILKSLGQVLVQLTVQSESIVRFALNGLNSVEPVTPYWKNGRNARTGNDATTLTGN